MSQTTQTTTTTTNTLHKVTVIPNKRYQRAGLESYATLLKKCTRPARTSTSSRTSHHSHRPRTSQSTTRPQSSRSCSRLRLNKRTLTPNILRPFVLILLLQRLETYIDKTILLPPRRDRFKRSTPPRPTSRSSFSSTRPASSSRRPSRNW